MNQPELARLVAQLTQHEGVRLKPYTDTVGKLTIGIGRNLTDKGITYDEAQTLLRDDIREAERDILKRLPWFDGLNEVRRRVLLDMAFNLGIHGLMTFTNTLAAIERGDYPEAAAGMRASKWAGQVGRRAQRLAEMMETGEEVAWTSR